MAKKTVRSQAKIDNVVQQPNTGNLLSRQDMFVSQEPAQNRRGMQVARALTQVGNSLSNFTQATAKQQQETQLRNIAGTIARIESDGGGYIEHESWDQLHERPRMLIAEHFGNLQGDEEIRQHEEYLSKNKNVLLNGKFTLADGIERQGLEEYIKFYNKQEITSLDSYGMHTEAAKNKKMNDYFNKVRETGRTERAIEHKANLQSHLEYYTQAIFGEGIVDPADPSGNTLLKGWDGLSKWYDGYFASGSPFRDTEAKDIIITAIGKGVEDGSINAEELDVTNVPSIWKNREVIGYIEAAQQKIQTDLLRNQQMIELNDKKELRANKIQILKDAEAGTLNPEDYIGNVSVYEFAKQQDLMARGELRSLITATKAKQMIIAANLADNPSLLGEDYKDFSSDTLFKFISDHNIYGRHATDLINLAESLQSEPIKYTDFFSYNILTDKIKNLKTNEKDYFGTISSDNLNYLDNTILIDQLESRVIETIQENIEDGRGFTNSDMRSISNEIYKEYEDHVRKLKQNQFNRSLNSDYNERIIELNEQIAAQETALNKARTQGNQKQKAREILDKLIDERRTLIEDQNLNPAVTINLDSNDNKPQFTIPE